MHSIALAVFLLIASAPPAGAEKKEQEPCSVVYPGLPGCRIIPADQDAVKALLSRFPDKEPVLEDMSGPGWELASACKKARDGHHALTIDALCSATRKACSRDLGQYGCSDSTVPTQRRRFWNREARLKAYPIAAQVLERWSKDASLHAECCGGGDSCEERLCRESMGKVRMAFVDFSKVTDEHALKKAKGEAYDRPGHIQYTSYANNSATDHVICVDEGRPLHYATLQGFEQTALHELGHACENSKWIAESLCRMPEGEREKADLAVVDDPLDKCYGSAPIAEKHLQALLGEPAARCIKDRMFAFAASKPKYLGKEIAPLCTGIWLKEAYADAVFMTHWRSLSHWSDAWCQEDILDIVDWNNGPRRITLECIFQNQQVVDDLCSQ